VEACSLSGYFRDLLSNGCDPDGSKSHVLDIVKLDSQNGL
jgi:hypothetical protein